MILERIPESRYSRVLRAWEGEAVAILAGGSSLTLKQFEITERAHAEGRLRVIAINDSYLRAPYADVHYAADAKWHAWHNAGIDKPAIGLTAAEVREKWAAFKGQKCALQGCGEPGNEVHLLKNAAHPYNPAIGDISKDPTKLYPGRNSGFQAINLALLAGAKTLLLLGYDAKKPDTGASHWHGEHPKENTPPVYEEMRRVFSKAERELVSMARIINCSPTSELGFEKIPLELAVQEAL